MNGTNNTKSEFKEIEPFGALTECKHQHPRYSCVVCNKEQEKLDSPTSISAELADPTGICPRSS